MFSDYLRTILHSFFKPLVCVVVNIFWITAFAQSPTATAANAGNAVQNSGSKYEAALEDYYNLVFNNEIDIDWILGYYRRQSGKLDKKFDYIRSPEFSKEASKRFKENWKSKARVLLNINDLEYLKMFQNSALRQKLIEMESSFFQKESLVPLFDSVQMKPPVTTSPVKPAPAPVKR